MSFAWFWWYFSPAISTILGNLTLWCLAKYIVFCAINFSPRTGTTSGFYNGFVSFWCLVIFHFGFVCVVLLYSSGYIFFKRFGKNSEVSKLGYQFLMLIVNLVFCAALFTCSGCFILVKFTHAYSSLAFAFSFCFWLDILCLVGSYFYLNTNFLL